MDIEDFSKYISAHGGMTEFYQAAVGRYAFSQKLIDEPGWEPQTAELDKFLAVFHEHLVLLQQVFLLRGDIDGAILTRRRISGVLDEMKALR